VSERGGRLAETHVVGQATTKPDSVQELQPAETAALVRTQRGREAGRLGAFGQRGVGQAVEQIVEPAGGGEHWPVDRRGRLVGPRNRRGGLVGAKFGGESQELDGRQFGMVATMFGEVGEGPSGLAAIEAHPPPVDVDEPGARCGGALEHGLVDRRVVDDHGPVDDRRGAESSGSAGLARSRHAPGTRRAPGETLRCEQFDLDGG
jgi:hypothetical protein